VCPLSGPAKHNAAGPDENRAIDVVCARIEEDRASESVRVEWKTGNEINCALNVLRVIARDGTDRSFDVYERYRHSTALVPAEREVRNCIDRIALPLIGVRV